MVLAAPLLGFTGYLHVFRMVQKAFDFEFPRHFHDISRIFTWFWQPPFWDLQDIYMFFVQFKKPSTSNFHDISRIFPWFWQPPFYSFWDLQDIYMFFVWFKKPSNSNFMMYSGYFQDIYMVPAAPLLGFTGYLHVFRTV